MRRLLPTIATAALLAGLLANPAGAGAAATIAPAHGFAPRKVVVKFEGERRGRTLALPAGAGVRETAAALRDNPRVAYAEPDYVATASASEPGSAFVLPNDPGTLDGASGAAASAGDWAFKQWNFLPFEGDGSGRVSISPGGIDAVGAWRNLAERGPARSRRRDRRRARHRHRLPRPRQRVPAQPRLRLRPVRQGLRLRRRRPFAARRKRPRHPRRRDDRREDRQRGRAHRPRLPGEADAGAGARQARPRPGQRDRQGHPLRRRPPRPGDQHELQLRLRQEGAGDRRSAARGLRARRRHRRLGRQHRLGDLRLGAGDRAAGDRRRRHHRGRLPRQLLAGRQGDRPGRTRRRHTGPGLPLGLGPADLPGDAERGLDPDLRHPLQLRRHLDGRGPRQRRRRDGAGRRHLRRAALLPGNRPGRETARQWRRQTPARNRAQPGADRRRSRAPA